MKHSIESPLLWIWMLLLCHVSHPAPIGGAGAGMRLDDSFCHLRSLDDEMRAYLKSEDKLEFLLALPEKNTIVAHLFELDDVLTRILSLSDDGARLRVYENFESKKFVFGAALYYASPQMFDIVHERRFNMSRLSRFRDRLIPPLNCLRATASEDGHSDMGKIFEVVQLIYCPSSSAYQGTMSIEEQLRVCSTMEALGSSETLLTGLQDLAKNLVQAGLFPGPSSNTNDWRSMLFHNEQSLLLEALQSRPWRPFLRFLLVEDLTIEEQRALFYSFTWWDFYDYGPLLLDVLETRLGKLVEAERGAGRISVYLKSMAKEMPAFVPSSTLILLYSRLELKELLLAPPALIVTILNRILLNESSQPILLMDGEVFDMMQQVRLIAGCVFYQLMGDLAGAEQAKMAIQRILAPTMDPSFQSTFFALMSMTQFRQLYLPGSNEQQQEVFFSGLLSAVCYASMTLTDLLQVMPQASIQCLASRFLSLVAKLRVGAESKYLFPAIYKCEIAANFRNEFPEKAELLAVFKPLEWDDYKMADEMKAYYYFQIAHFDAPLIYSHLTMSMVSSLMRVSKEQGDGRFQSRSELLEYCQLLIVAPKKADENVELEK